MDISGDSKGLFEYRADSKNRKKPFKKKAQVITLRSKMLKNDSGLLNNSKNNKSVVLNSQNSYEYFQTKKKKK